MSLSANTIDAMYRETAHVVALWIAEITHPNIETLRIVNNEEDIASGGYTYTACGFEFRQPDEREKGARPAQVRINNADLWLVSTLRALDDRVRVKFSLVSHTNLSPTPPQFNTVEIDLEPMKIAEAQMNSEYADLDLIYTSLAQESYPPDTFNPNDYRRIR